jgi:hydrogenase maturation protease
MRMKTLIVGLGNPCLGDDGVGWQVAETVSGSLAETSPPGAAIRRQPATAEVECLSLGGLSLMERMAGYDRVILIDAVTTGQQPPGSINRLPLEDLPDRAAGRLGSVHDTSLQTALKMGRSLGVPLPNDVTIVGVEAECLFDFTEELTPPVAAAVPLAARMVLEMLEAQAHDLP